jgi:hypothetical protein
VETSTIDGQMASINYNNGKMKTTGLLHPFNRLRMRRYIPYTVEQNQSVG